MKNVFRLSASALIAAAALATATPLAAQTTLGVSGGLTSSTFEGDDAPDLDSKTGFMAGVHLAFPLTDIVSLVPGAFYVQKGAALGDDSQTLSYLEVPLLLSVNVLTEDRPVGLNLFAGPEVAFKVGCSVDDDGESGDCDEESEPAGTDFGFIAGAGVSFGRFFVNGGLDLGLKSIDDSTEENDVKNSTWFVAAGIEFPLGG